MSAGPVDELTGEVLAPTNQCLVKALSFSLGTRGGRSNEKTITVQRHNLRPIPKNEVIARREQSKSKKMTSNRRDGKKLAATR